MALAEDSTYLLPPAWTENSTRHSPQTPSIPGFSHPPFGEDVSSVSNGEKIGFTPNKFSVSFRFQTLANPFGSLRMMGIVMVLMNTHDYFCGIDYLGFQLPGPVEAPALICNSADREGRHFA